MDATWDRYRQLLFRDADTGFALDLSRVPLADGELAGMGDRLREAVAAMHRLEGGAVANADENRMVGHYWLRKPELAPSAELTEQIRTVQDSVRSFAAETHAGRHGRFTHVLLVGIGGSALGPQFVADALGTAEDPMAIRFIDNTDPDGIDRTLTSLADDLPSTLVVVVSKSGGTPETRNGMLEAQAAFAKAGVEFPSHAVAVTQEGSKLDRIAADQGWLRRFPMEDWVGGRTSVMSAVGLLPAALQGIDTAGLLAGAAAMDELTRRDDPMQNPAALLAAAWFQQTGGKGQRDMVILPYKDRLALFAKYLQQLVMESLGKKHDRDGAVVHQGIAVYGNKGSTDQHSYVQQLRDGIANFFVTFVRVMNDGDGPALKTDGDATTGDFLNAFLLGTRAALADADRASITVTVPDVTPRTVGMLIALYERTVGIYAELVNVNAYHQPGVEAGKKAAAGVLDVQKKVLAALSADARDAPALAAAAGIDDVETAYHILVHLAANGRAAQSGDGPDATFSNASRS